MSRKHIIALYTALSWGAGIIWQIWLGYSTPVAFKIRPELTLLTFWEALTSGHFNEWLYRFHPFTMFFLNIVLMPIVGFLASWWVTRNS